MPDSSPRATLPAYAIVLAAGASSRMGREKASLPWIDGEPLLIWTVENLATTGWRPFVVLGPSQFHAWRDSLPPGAAVLNPDPSRGKSSSLRAGLACVPNDAAWILVTSVDQPRPPAVYRRLRAACTPGHSRIHMPDAFGHRGHPVVVSGTLRAGLAAVDEATLGLRGFLNRHEDVIVRIPDMDHRWLTWDLNTPEDYQKALTYFRGNDESAVTT